MRHLPGFGIEVTPTRERVLLAVTGELDLDTTTELEAALDQVRANGFDHIVVDLRAVTFMDSTGLALLVSENEKSGELSIAYRDGPVKRLLELTGLLGHFDTRPVAVNELGRSRATAENWESGLQGLRSDSAIG